MDCGNAGESKRVQTHCYPATKKDNSMSRLPSIIMGFFFSVNVCIALPLPLPRH